MLDIFRDSSVGQIINWASKGKYAPYADELPGYVVPAKYLATPLTSPTGTLCGDLTGAPLSKGTTLVEADGVLEEKKTDSELEKGDSKREDSSLPAPYPYLVDWEGDDDQDNPRNWSKNKRLYVAFCISLLTFSVYIGSAIYTSAIPSLMNDFGVDPVTAVSGLTLFVLAYGMGPMILAPIQEVAYVGRNPVYIIGLFLFVLFQVPGIVAKNIETILIFRFLSGFVGSPALATGGASMGDIFSARALPYAIGIWSLGAVSGPVFGPVVGGFAAEANGWAWPTLILLWISGFAFIVLSISLPETLGSTVLLRRAERLRKLTGNSLLKTQDELDRKEGSTLASEVSHNFIRAFQLCAEPAIAFSNAYIALVYAIFYLWFEAFPLVFGPNIYNFSLGIGGLPFLGFIVTGVITFILYAYYNKYVMEPRMDADPNLLPETRLELAIVAAFFIPISLFIFGWTARVDVHWIAPVIGAALYLPGIYLAFQCIITYITMGYPKHQASILAGNDLFRSTFASFFPLFGSRFFEVLGLGGGSSLLAGVSILMIPILYALMKYGPQLRARSKWTD